MPRLTPYLTRLSLGAAFAAALALPFTSAEAQPPAPAPAAPSAPTDPAPKLETLVGDYELTVGRVMTITLENGVLYGHPTGGEKRALPHLAGATFGVENSPATVTFTIDADGRVTGLSMNQNGRVRTLTRIR